MPAMQFPLFLSISRGITKLGRAESDCPEELQGTSLRALRPNIEKTLNFVKGVLLCCCGIER